MTKENYSYISDYMPFMTEFPISVRMRRAMPKRLDRVRVGARSIAAISGGLFKAAVDTTYQNTRELLRKDINHSSVERSIDLVNVKIGQYVLRREIGVEGFRAEVADRLNAAEERLGLPLTPAPTPVE